MPMRKLSAYTLIALLLSWPSVIAQSASQTRSVSPKGSKPTTVPAPSNPTAADVYSSLLAMPDINSDPNLKKIVYAAWVDATCKGEQQKLLSIKDVSSLGPTFIKAVYAKCSEKWNAQPIPSGGPVSPPNGTSSPSGNNAQTGATNPSTQDVTSLNAAVESVSIPAGCSSVPAPGQKVDPSTQAQNSVGPIPMKSADIPTKWLHLNATGSGAELHTKDPVWVGYVNTLRYSASLGGVVTPIQVPAIPNLIIPSAPAPPTSKTTTATSQGRPLGTPTPNANTTFSALNNCINQIQAQVVSFQSNLAAQELLLNQTRLRISQLLNQLQPMANSAAEARASADLSIFPTKVVPPFPTSDVVALRGLLSEVQTQYSQIEQWATATGHEATYQAESETAVALGSALDKYLIGPDVDSSGGTADSSGSSGQEKSAISSGNGSGSAANSSGSTGSASTISTTSEANHTGSSGSPTVQSTASTGTRTSSRRTLSQRSLTGGSQPNGSAASATGSVGSVTTGSNNITSGTSSSNGTSPVSSSASSDLCAASNLEDSSKEVNDYEANRCYIDVWLQQFRKVAGANDQYFIVSFSPVCGGWFGQGTSTQIQLTTIDSLNPSKITTPANLDKIVCQPVITVTNGIGISFVGSKAPAFVAGIQKDSSGNPVLGSNGNPTIIQVLGYSSRAPVNPGYAVQANAAFWAKKDNFVELHWSVGAMLTAATGGTTTDLTVGPSFSFKKRAFFVSPVYDLGYRTDYQSGFTVGAPQGNLTSPPTGQFWRSGFGLMITFPFTQTTTSQNSSSASQGSGTGQASSTSGGSSGGGKGTKTSSSKTVTPAPANN
jgi:hypothetical protein